MNKSIPIISLVLATALIASAQNLYEETFATPPPSGTQGTLAQFGWTPTGDFNTYGYSGTYNYAVVDAATLQPINGQSAVYMGSGAAVNEGFFTTDAASSLSGFTDLAFTGSLKFGVYDQIASGYGDSGNETAYFLVQDGGNWYASANPISGPGPSDAQNTYMYKQTMVLGPTAANWIAVTGIGTSSITFGTTPGTDLGGTISGTGIVFTLNNANYATFNYADYTISAVPEPGSMALISLGVGGFLFVLRLKSR